jgi:hypothetical protein
VSDRAAVGADDPRNWTPLALAIAALALLASVTSLGNGFAYDDRWIIVENLRAHSLHAPWKFFAETYWPTVRGAALYRPLTILLYATQWKLGGGSPLIFHLVSVALYVIACVLVFWLALQILPRTAAWVAAALFAVHPVHVEAVGNVVGQAELWTAVLMIGAVALYVRDRRSGLDLERRSAVAIVALFVAGMLIKENAIVLPALLVAADYFLCDDPRPRRERVAAIVPLLVWMTLCAAIFLYVRVRILHGIGGDVSHPSLQNLGIVQRTVVMLGLFPEFGRLFLWPAQLYADYSPRQVHTFTSWNVQLIPGLLMLLSVATLWLVSWRRQPVVAFGLAWLAIAIAPVSNIFIPTGILIAERTLLVPSLGAVLAAAVLVPWVMAQLRGKPRLAYLGAGGVLALVLTLGAARSAERQYAWKDSETVFLQLAVDAPTNFKSHYALGGLYFESKHPVEGEREWRFAIALMPGYYGVYTDLGHKYRDAHVCQAAIPNYQKALSLEPALPLARAGLVACYLELAQYRRARAESRSAIADGFYRCAFEYMISHADSALVATDTLDGENRWRAPRASQCTATQLAIDSVPIMEAGTPAVPPIVVKGLDPSGARSRTFAGSVTLSLAANPSGAKLSGTLTMAAVAGVATFRNVTVDKPGDGFTLTAVSAKLSAPSSPAFRVTTGQAQK